MFKARVLNVGKLVIFHILEQDKSLYGKDFGTFNGFEIKSCSWTDLHSHIIYLHGSDSKPSDSPVTYTCKSAADAEVMVENIKKALVLFGKSLVKSKTCDSDTIEF